MEAEKRSKSAALAKSYDEDAEDPWPDLDDDAAWSDDGPEEQLEAKPQAAQDPPPSLSRSRAGDPAWRVDLARNRSRLLGLRTREADALREQAELVRQALDVGASVSAICRVLRISRTAFYGRYGDMVRRAREPGTG